MFGHLRVKRCAVSSDQHGDYQADFCSLCHSLRQTSGLLASLLTNYDSTLWLTLARGLSPGPGPPATRRPCTALPWRKVRVHQFDPLVSGSNVAILWLLAEAKAVDDVLDEGRWPARAFLRWSAARISASEAYLQSVGFPTAVLRDIPRLQSLAETASRPRLVEVAEPTCRGVGEIFAHLGRVCHRLDLVSELRALGREIGFGIYLKDARDDYNSDLRNGRFNPIANCQDFAHAWSLGLSQSVRRRLADLPLQTTVKSLALAALSSLGVSVREGAPPCGVMPTLGPVSDDDDCCTGCCKQCGVDCCSSCVCNCGDAAGCCDCCSCCSC